MMEPPHTALVIVVNKNKLVLLRPFQVRCDATLGDIPRINLNTFDEDSEDSTLYNQEKLVELRAESNKLISKRKNHLQWLYHDASDREPEYWTNEEFGLRLISSTNFLECDSRLAALRGDSWCQGCSKLVLSASNMKCASSSEEEEPCQSQKDHFLLHTSLRNSAQNGIGDHIASKLHKDAGQPS